MMALVVPELELITWCNTALVSCEACEVLIQEIKSFNEALNFAFSAINLSYSSRSLWLLYVQVFATFLTLFELHACCRVPAANLKLLKLSSYFTAPANSYFSQVK